MMGHYTGCAVPDHHGPKHKGHRGCIREQRRLEAEARRTAKMATPKEIGNRQGLGSPDTSGHSSRRVVSKVQDQASLQRESPAAQQIRAAQERVRNPLAVPNHVQRSR
jgi:hypothetical protein